MNDTIRKQQAVSLLNAMAPLIGTVIDPAALARHVLQQGFGIKNPDKFIMQQQPQPEMGGDPNAAAGMPPDMLSAPLPAPNQAGAFAPTGGIPPELLAQMQGQMGLDLANL